MRRPAVTALGGKVRVEPDFAPLAYGEPCLSFARWMEAGAAYAQHVDPAWRDRFVHAPPVAFIFRAPPPVETGSLLLGVLGPSEDRFAHPFPFAITTELREPNVGADASLPVAAERFLALATGVCADARSARRAADLVARAQELQPPAASERERAARDLLDWKCQDGILAALWPLLFTSGSIGAEICLRELISVLDGIRPSAQRGAGLTLRLPLGGGGAAAASFWLEVVRATTRRSALVPTAFWPAEDAAGAVLVRVGDISAESFADVWSPALSPRVVDLGAPEDRTARPCDPLSPTLAALLNDRSASVAMLLDALGGRSNAERGRPSQGLA